MPRYRDNAPVGNTCPMIDEVISALGDAEWNESSWYDEKSVTEIMEKIRSANSELREWGNDEYQRAEDNEKEKEEAESEKDNLEWEIEQLKDKIKDLEFELSAVE